jgi:multisubunit Na+/H+ antiporter MnhE subunit
MGYESARIFAIIGLIAVVCFGSVFTQLFPDRAIVGIAYTSFIAIVFALIGTSIAILVGWRGERRRLEQQIMQLKLQLGSSQISN